MSVQTSYSMSIDQAYAGQIYALHPHDIDSFSVETVAGAAFGIAVSRGTDKERQAVIGGASGFLGITVRDLAHEGAANTGALQYEEKETAAVMSEGYIWAVCPSGCVPGNLVQYLDATGVLDSGAAAAGSTQLDTAFWQSTTAAGEIGLIKINDRSFTAGV